MADEQENLTLFAAELGRMGGRKTAERGPEYFAAIQAKRTTRGGGRPKNPPRAAHEGVLTVGSLKIACYVLEDGTRLITQRGVQTTIGMSTSGGTGGAHRTAQFVEKLESKLSHTNDLSLRMRNPILFMPVKGGLPAYGYEATTLMDLCELLLKARDVKDVLTPHQQNYAKAADIVIRAFAKVGIIALVDEATGYQYFRARTALEEILEKFIATEFRKWVKTFPDEFYREMFRLRGWDFKEDTVKRTPLVGKLTLDLVYDRLAPGVRQRLEAVNPRNEKGHRKHKLFTRLTEDIGDPSLRAHLASVITLMRVNDDWQTFLKMLNRALPRFVAMPLFDPTEPKALPETTA